MSLNTQGQMDMSDAVGLVSDGGLLSLASVPTSGPASSTLATSAFSFGSLSQAAALEVVAEAGSSGGKSKGGSAGSKDKQGKSPDGLPAGPAASEVQRASDLCSSLLKKASESQKLLVQLEPLGFSSDMVAFLKKFNGAVMTIHNKMWPFVIAGNDDVNTYEKYHTAAEELSKAWDARKKLASAMVNAAKPKKKKDESQQE